MSHKLLSVVALMSLLALTTMAEAKKIPSTPAGTRMASGKQFDIYVALKESKPWAAAHLMLNIYATTVVVHHTRRHGRQLFRSRLEAVDADLLDSSMWQIGDFNGDGFDDYRAVSGRDKKGCSTWQTQTWLPDRERFTFAAKITYLTDASGNEVKSCYPRKQK
ncbi:MAG: hypothetical protein Q8O64_18620 [Sideroxyarcus sp.]|nr:hypothetical protein [Sideroxyarcus sp.]